MKVFRILAALLVATNMNDPLLALDRGALLIDVSASMNTVRADGQTRCEVAFQTAEKALIDFFDKANGTALRIFSFSSSGALQPHSVGYMDRSSALQSFRSIPRTCDGSATALAESICAVVDDLRRNSPGEQSELGVFLMTDGKENASQSCHQSPGFMPDEIIKRPWHKAVFDYVLTGPSVRVASLVFWPQSDEIPDDFEFLKYLSLMSGSDLGGGLSNGVGPVGPQRPDPAQRPSLPQYSKPKATAFSVLADDRELTSGGFSFW